MLRAGSLRREGEDHGMLFGGAELSRDGCLGATGFRRLALMSCSTFAETSEVRFP